MLTPLTFTILQTGMYNFEFYCHYPPWYLKYTHNNKKICAPRAWSPWTFTPTVSKEMNMGIELRLVTAATDSILRLTWISAAGCELWLMLSCGWLEFRRLDMSCGWFYQTLDSSSGGWIRVAATFILQLTRVPATEYKLQLILSCGWLEFRLLNTSCGWLYPVADSNSGGWKPVAADSITRLTRVPPAE